MYSSEKKGAYQVGSYCSADMRLCFCICKSPFFHKEVHKFGHFENQYEGTDQTAFDIILFNDCI